MNCNPLLSKFVGCVVLLGSSWLMGSSTSAQTVAETPSWLRPLSAAASAPANDQAWAFMGASGLSSAADDEGDAELLPPPQPMKARQPTPHPELPTQSSPIHLADPLVNTGSYSSVLSPSPQYVATLPNQSACPSCGGNGSGDTSCRTCADRNGDGHWDEFGHQQGVFTGTKDEYQCWQNPCSSPFNNYGQGGYAGPARTQHLMEYRLRPGDVVRFTYLLSDRQTESNYRLTVGDELLIESEADVALTRGTLEKGLEIQPDGTITLRFVGQVQAAGQTVESLREQLNQKYLDLELYEDPAIDVTPVVTGTSAKRIRDAISGTGGFTEQEVDRTVTPQGDVQLPRLGNVPAHGLTLSELKQEINLRYDSVVGGIEVEPSLVSQAPHYVYVLGEVATPGRFNLDQPTTVLSSLALAGGDIPGANLRQIVIFRRGENWELMSTLLDLRGAVLGRAAQPRDEIWLQDGDVVIVPRTPIRIFDNFVRLVFTEGIYGIVPFQGFSIALGDGAR